MWKLKGFKKKKKKKKIAILFRLLFAGISCLGYCVQNLRESVGKNAYHMIT